MNEVMRATPAIVFEGVGKENAGAHQTHNCCNCLDHRKRSFAPHTGAPYGRTVICLARKNGRRLPASQLYKWFIAAYVGTTGVARNGGQRIYGADCEHRLAGGQVLSSVPRRGRQPRGRQINARS